jgi:hypothetical protein
LTTHDSLDPVHVSPGGENAKLLERTFRHGQGTKRSNPEIRKLKQAKAPAKADILLGSQPRPEANAGAQRERTGTDGR